MILITNIIIFAFTFLLSSLFSLVEIMFFSSILKSNNLLITFGSKQVDLFYQSPLLLKNIKLIFVLFAFLANLILFNYIFNYILSLFPKKTLKYNINNSNVLSINLGKIHNSDEDLLLPEKGLYQNILITGAIGSGKTSSAMYPITEQLISYRSSSQKEKLGMLILDVKGNYYLQVLKFASKYNRQDDVIPIEISGKYKYNPLDNPSLKASVLAIV